MSTPRWEDRLPGYYQRELEALRAAGITFEVDAEFLKHRILRVAFSHAVDGIEIRGHALYPDLFPYFPPIVDAEPLGLTHHQNPLVGILCLVGRGGDRWVPSLTLARLLTEKLPIVLASGSPEASDEAIALEDVQAEPYSAYVSPQPGSAILVDGSWQIPSDVEWGRLVIGTSDRATPDALRAAVLEVKDGAGTLIVTADPAVLANYPHRHHARWARAQLQNPGDINSVLAEAADRIPDYAKRNCPQIQLPSGKLNLLAIVIPEEVAHRKGGQGWLFFVKPEAPVSGKKGKKGKKQRPGYFAKPAYAGRDDLRIRVPELEPLRDKAVAVFGLGSLGAPATLELARAGIGELRLLDKDIVDAGPVVRWPFGLKDVGRKKVDVLHDFIRDHYPYTKVRHHYHEIGEAAQIGRKADQTVLDEILNGADLIFDATANLNVQCMLADMARERHLPYVMVEGRHGGWGGVVFRQDPAVGTACLHCLLHALQHDAEPRIAGAPAATPIGVQARGCGDVTFTGTGFDMATIALDAVRRAIGTLCDGAYPNSPGNVAVIALRGENGEAISPVWTTTDLAPHPACGCSVAAA